MNYKNTAAALLFVLIPATSCAYDTYDSIQLDFFRCETLSRADIALNAALNGDLSEDMIADLKPEDREVLIASINNTLAQSQAELLTPTQQQWHKAAAYAAGTVAIAGCLAYFYNSFRVLSNGSAWSYSSNLAWNADSERKEGWQAKYTKHLGRSAFFRWETGKSMLLATGTSVVYTAAGLAWTLLQNIEAQNEAAVAECQNLKDSLELINANTQEPLLEVAQELEIA